MKHRPGITVLETLVVVVLCVLALGLLAILIVNHRENAQRMQCTLNLKAMGEAFHAYQEATSPDKANQYLPPSRIAPNYATWAVLIAPHLTKEHALTKWDVPRSYFDQPAEVREAALVHYFCPSRSRSTTLSASSDVNAKGDHVPGALGDYAGVAGDGSDDWTSPKANGALVSADGVEIKDGRAVQWHSVTKLGTMPRGEAYTMLLGEKHVALGHMGEAQFGDGSLYNGQNPASYSRVAGPGFPIASSSSSPFNRNFGSYHNGVCNFLMADTSVRPMTFNSSEFVLGELARRGE
jgi:prepilin-type processing-associated H-X9-DG protein